MIERDDTALEVITEKYQQAIEKLNKGLKRKVKKIPRKLKGKEDPAKIKEPSESWEIDSNYTNVSYYEEPEPQIIYA